MKSAFTSPVCRAKPAFVPRFEMLEDRCIPGSLWSLADPFPEPFETVGGNSSGIGASALSRPGQHAPLSLAKDHHAGPAHPMETPRPTSPSQSAEIPTSLVDRIFSAAGHNLWDIDSERLPKSARGAQITVQQNLGAFAFFTHTEGCILTDSSIIANNDTTSSLSPKEGDEAGALHGLVVFVRDECDGQVLLDAQGFVTDPGTFDVTPDGRSATLSATFTALNLPTGHNIDFTVSMTWQAIGKATTTTTIERLESGGISIIREWTRPAVATGTVSDGTTNYTPLPITDAQISGIVSIEIVPRR